MEMFSSHLCITTCDAHLELLVDLQAEEAVSKSIVLSAVRLAENT